MNRTVPQIYRDCLRTINHVAGRSSKGLLMRALLRREFRKNGDIEDQEHIDELKRNAMSGLANYLALQSVSQLHHVDGTSARTPLTREAEVVSSRSTTTASSSSNATDADASSAAARTDALPPDVTLDSVYEDEETRAAKAAYLASLREQAKALREKWKREAATSSS